MSKNLRQLKDQISDLEAQRLAVIGKTKQLTPKRKELEVEIAYIQREIVAIRKVYA
jgi:hypothetical protein